MPPSRRPLDSGSEAGLNKSACPDKPIAAILGLSEGMTETRGSLNDTIRLSPDFGAEPGGAWEISAAAPGYAPTKTRIPAQ
jgi:cytochrome c